MMNTLNRAACFSAVLAGFLTLALPTATLSKDVAPLTVIWSLSTYFLEPDAAMLRRAEANNTRLRKLFPNPRGSR